MSHQSWSGGFVGEVPGEVCKLRGEIDDENQTRSLSKLGMRKAIGRKTLVYFRYGTRIPTFTYVHVAAFMEHLGMIEQSFYEVWIQNNPINS